MSAVIELKEREKGVCETAVCEGMRGHEGAEDASGGGGRRDGVKKAAARAARDAQTEPIIGSKARPQRGTKC